MANQAERERGGRKGWAGDLVKNQSGVHREPIIDQLRWRLQATRAWGRLCGHWQTHERSSCPQQTTEMSRESNLGRVYNKLPTQGLLDGQPHRKPEGTRAVAGSL